MGRRGRTAGPPQGSGQGDPQSGSEPYVPSFGDGDGRPATDLLENSPFEGELNDKLAAKPRRTVRPSVTVYLSAGVLLVAGFVGGIQADKQWGSGSSSATGAAGLGGGSGAARGAAGTAGRGPGATTGGGFGGGAGGAVTFGTVKLVDGNTVYVQTPGGIIAVKTTGSTQIRISKTGTVKDLPPGSAVVVQGPTGGDGSVAATTITEGGGAGGRGGALGAGGGGNGRPGGGG